MASTPLIAENAFYVSCYGTIRTISFREYQDRNDTTQKAWTILLDTYEPVASGPLFGEYDQANAKNLEDKFQTFTIEPLTAAQALHWDKFSDGAAVYVSGYVNGRVWEGQRGEVSIMCIRGNVWAIEKWREHCKNANRNIPPATQQTSTPPTNSKRGGGAR